jgi:5-methyltetrahydrofolate--homocysteine methyltransferase
MTFDKNGRTLTGTTPEIMVDFLEGLGVSALGVNCSLGPNELYPVIERILKASSTPVIIQPNRGLPKFENGRSYYDLTVEEFTESVGKFTEMGVSVIGGCCGTDPEFITSIARFKGNPVALTEAVKKNGIASYSKYTEIDGTASIEDYSVSDDVSEDDLDDIAFEIMDIADDGADAIKLIAENTDVGTFSALCRKIQEYSNVPLILSGNAEIIEEAVRYYNGVAVIELIEDGTEALTDLAMRYGAKLFVSIENKGLLDKITFSDKRTVIS